MKWINVKDNIPTKENKYIVAVVAIRQKYPDDPIKDAEVLILRNYGDGEFRGMNDGGAYYVPPRGYGDREITISYWMDWGDFVFPEEMINKVMQSFDEEKK